MAILDIVLEKAAVAAGTVLLKLVDYLQAKQDQRASALPPLAKPLPELSINEAVRRANAQRAYRNQPTLEELHAAARADLEDRRKNDK